MCKLKYCQGRKYTCTLNQEKLELKEKSNEALDKPISQKVEDKYHKEISKGSIIVIKSVYFKLFCLLIRYCYDLKNIDLCMIKIDE